MKKYKSPEKYHELKMRGNKFCVRLKIRIYSAEKQKPQRESNKNPTKGGSRGEKLKN